MPVTVLVEFFRDGLSKEFLQIGRGEIMSLELKRKEQKCKKKKKNVYHMSGRKRKERLRLNKPEPEIIYFNAVV